MTKKIKQEIEQDITQESKKEIRKEIKSSKKKLLSLRMNKSSGELKDTSVFKKTKKDVARLFTKLNKKEN